MRPFEVLERPFQPGDVVELASGSDRLIVLTAIETTRGVLHVNANTGYASVFALPQDALIDCEAEQEALEEIYDNVVFEPCLDPVVGCCIHIGKSSMYATVTKVLPDDQLEATIFIDEPGVFTRIVIPRVVAMDFRGIERETPVEIAILT